MVTVVIMLVATALQPLAGDGFVEPDSLRPVVAPITENSSADSARVAKDSAVAESPAEQPAQPEGPPGSDVLYLTDGSIVIGRVLGTRGRNIKVFVASKDPRQQGYVVQFDRNLVRTMGKVATRDSTWKSTPAWRTPIVIPPRFGRLIEGIRIPSYPQICPEIGIAYLKVDFDELQRGIQRIYDTDPVLAPYRLKVESFEEEMISFPMGVVIRVSPCAAFGLTGFVMQGGPVKGRALGELRLRPPGANWPWLSLGAMWQRIKVTDDQRVEVSSSGSHTVWYDGATWRSSSTAPSLGVRFDTAGHTRGGLTMAFYWFAAPQVRPSLRSEWSEWRPSPSAFPATIRTGSFVFTAGIQFN